MIKISDKEHKERMAERKKLRSFNYPSSLPKTKPRVGGPPFNDGFDAERLARAERRRLIRSVR